MNRRADVIEGEGREQKGRCYRTHSLASCSASVQKLREGSVLVRSGESHGKCLALGESQYLLTYKGSEDSCTRKSSLGAC